MEVHLRSEGLWDTIRPGSGPAPFLSDDLMAVIKSRRMALPQPGNLRIEPLHGNGDNYRMWRKQVGVILRAEGLWDVVSPDCAPPVDEFTEGFGDSFARVARMIRRGEIVQGGEGESMNSARASVIIFEYCDKHSLSHVIHLKTAAERWAKLKTVYGPRLSQLDRLCQEFHGYAPAPGTSVSAIAQKLDEIAEDIEEVHVESKKSDRLRVLALVGAVGRAGAGRRGEAVWDGARIRIFIKEGKCTYEEALEDLLTCERVVGAPGGGGGGGKRRRRGRGKKAKAENAANARIEDAQLLEARRLRGRDNDVLWA